MNIRISRLIIKLFPIIIFFFCWANVYSQLYGKLDIINTDSLKKLIPLQNNRERIDTYFMITDGYFVTDPDSCFKYAQLALNLAANTNDEALIADANHYMGKACYFKGLYDQSIGHYLVAFDYFKESNNIKKILLLDELLVFAYYYSGNYDVAVVHMEEIKSHLKYMTDSSYLSHFIIGLGYFYRYMGYYNQAIPLFLQYIEINKSYPLPRVALALNSGHLGYCYEQTGKLENAIRYYLEDVKISTQMNINTRSYLQLGRVYEKMDSLKKAMDYYNFSVPFYEEHGNVYYKSLASSGLGRIYLRLGKYKESQAELLKALSLAEWVYKNKLLYKTLDTEIKNFYTSLQIVEKFKEEISLKLIADIHFELYRLYEKQSLTKKALDEYLLYHKTLDKLNNFEQIAAIEEIKNRYESEKKEQQISLLSQEKAMSELQLKQSRVIVFALGGLFLLAIAIAIMFIRMIKIRSEQKSVVLEQKLLRSQMNPHFIFNALSNITNLVEKQDNVSASGYLNRFARLVRHILESTREDFIPMDDELTNLENYLELQQLRFSNKFSYSIILEDDVDPEEILIPTMLVQPFVENAIEHGIKPKEDNGYVKIRFFKQGRLITCEVEDNGIGREQSIRIEPMKHPHRSYGVAIARERLAAMRKKIRMKVKMNIIDLKTDSGDASGTKVIINMPYKMAV